MGTTATVPGQTTARGAGGQRLGWARGAVAPLIRGVTGSPATWLFAAAWLGSAFVLVLSGRGFPFDGLLVGAGYLLLSALTVLLTRAAPVTPAPPAVRPRLRL